MKAPAIVILAALTLVLLAAPVLAADWPMAKKDAAHSSYADGPLSPPLEPAWTLGTGESVVASPVLSGGVLYFSNATGKGITAVDASTGRAVFMRTLPGSLESTPAVAGDTITLGSYDGYVYCLNKADGTVLWKTAFESGIYSSALAYQGRVYIGTDDGAFNALDQKSGSVVWSIPRSPTQGSPAGNDSKVFIGLLNGNVCALNASTGQLVWAYNTTDSVHSSPMIYNKTVYIASRSGTLYALDEDNGSVRWTASLGYKTDATPAIDPVTNTVFIGTFGGYTFAADANSGEFRWISGYCGPIYSTATVAGDVIYGCSQKGRLFALNVKDGSELWSYDVGSETWASPAIVDGRLYIGTMDGRIIAFRPTGTATAGTTATPAAMPPASTSASTPFPGTALVLAALVSAAAIIRVRR